MTRYCVQIYRTYEVQAEDEEHAKRLALADDWVQVEAEPTIIVTDLDALEAFVKCGADQPSGNV
jgi:hypothetical protein